MPDSNLTQVLGFDAAGAIATINQLKSALDSLNTSLGSVGSTVRNFNASGNVASKLYASMSKSIQGLATSVSKLQAMQQGVGQIGVDPSQVQNQLAAVNQLTQSWGSFSQKIPVATRQAFGKAKADLVSFAAQNKITAAQMTQAFAGGAQGSGAAIVGLNQKVQNLQKMHTNASSAIVANNKRMSLSFSWARALSFAVLMQALHALERAIWNGVKAAADFNRTLAKTIAIEPEVATKIGLIRNELLSIASMYGRDLADVSEAYYQTLQNQVGGAADSLFVLKAAAELASANVVTLMESEELLTAVMKGWNIETSQAIHLTDVMFEAIKVGRFTAADLADIIGRVGPLAHAMGVSFEESAAAIATMTVQGVRADTAITQLRAVLNQLLKPTKQLKAAMKSEWGVENAEQAIAKFGGLLPLLEKLERLAEGNSNKMAEFFKNIRALNAAIGLTGPNSELAAENLQKLMNVLDGTAENASDLVLESSTLQVSLNELSIAWARLGEAARPAFENILKGFKMMATGATWLVEKVGGIDSKLKDDLEKVQKTLTSVDENLRKEMTKTVVANQRKYDAMKTQAIDYITELNKIHQQEVTAVQSANKAIVDLTKYTFNSLIQTQQRYVDGIRLAVDQAENLKKSAKKESDLRISLEDKIFNDKISNSSAERQASAQMYRAEDLRSKALLMARSATSQEQLDAASALLARSQTYYSSASSSEKVLRGHKQFGLDLAKSEIVIEQQRQRVMQQASEIAKAELPLETERLRLMTEITGKILEGIRFDPTKDSKAIKKSYADAKVSFKQLIEVVKAGKPNMSLAEALDLAALNRQIDSMGEALPDFGLNVVFKNMDAEFARLQKTADILPVEIKVAFKVTDEFDPFGQLANNVIRSSEELKALEGRVSESQRAWATYGIDVKDTTGNLAESATITRDFIPATKYAANAMSEAGKQAVPLGIQYNRIIENLQNLQTLDPRSPLFKPALEGMRTDLGDWARTVASSSKEVQSQIRSLVEPETVMTVALELNRLMTSFDEISKKGLSLDEKIKYQQLQQDLPALKGQLEGMKQNLEGMPVPSGQFQTSMTNSVAPTGQTANNVGQINTVLSSVTTNAYNAETAFYAMADAAREAAEAVAASAGGGEDAWAGFNWARGGLQYLAKGGKRWTDTIPAMLSPGEFVINARAARNFFPQLQAMNAGQKPIFRDRGGSVTNNNIGDINVSVSQGETARHTARDIATALRRELRRGTSTLN